MIIRCLLLTRSHLKDAKRFLFEFDPTRQAEFQKKLHAAARYRPGEDIRSKIDPELLAWLQQNISTVGGNPRRWEEIPGDGF